MDISMLVEPFPFWWPVQLGLPKLVAKIWIFTRRRKPSITHCGRPAVAQIYTALHPASQLSSASSVPMRKSHLLHEAQKKNPWEETLRRLRRTTYRPTGTPLPPFSYKVLLGTVVLQTSNAGFGVVHAGTLTFLARPLRSCSFNPVPEGRLLGWMDSLSHHAAWQGAMGTGMRLAKMAGL